MYLGALASGLYEKGKLIPEEADKRQIVTPSGAKETASLLDRWIPIPLKTEDQQGTQGNSNSVPGDPSSHLSRDFFFGTTRRSPKRGLNRAYYNPILPPDESLERPFEYKPYSAPIERRTASFPPSSISRSSSWSPERRRHSGDAFVPPTGERRVSDWVNPGFGQTHLERGLFPSPPQSDVAAFSASGSFSGGILEGSEGSSDSVSSPAPNRTETGVQVGSPAVVKSPPSSEAAVGMHVSSPEYAVGTGPGARRDTGSKSAGSRRPGREMVSEEDRPSRGGSDADDFQDTNSNLDTSVSDGEAGGVQKGRLSWGGKTSEAEIMNTFGVRIRDILKLAERPEEVRKHLGGSEIAPLADNDQGLGDGGSPQMNNPDKAVDFEVLRAEHRRLSSMPNTPLGGESLPAAGAPYSEPATPPNRNGTEESGAAADEHRDEEKIREGKGGAQSAESRGGGGEMESGTAESVSGTEARLHGAGGAEPPLEEGKRMRGASDSELSGNLLDDESNGDSSSRYLMNSPQQDGEEASEGTSGRQLASLENHLVYDFAYEARQRQMEAEISDLDQMKERFSKLLLGEDMSGGGKGVSTALAISNAITNLSAAVFGELHKLEPLKPECKRKWKRELEWLLCPADHIVEMVPSVNKSVNGTGHEVMVLRQRADLHASLPALRKLDTMLTECLDSFAEKGFWYVDPGHSGEMPGGATPHQSDRWWLPEAMVPAEGLDERSLRKLANQKGVAKQILKAAMAINAQVLSEMAVPDAYWETLPKSSRAALGDYRYRVLTGDSFSPDMVLSTVKLSDEHSALKCANDLEAAIHIWRRKTGKKAGDQDRDKFGNGYSPAQEPNHGFRAALSNVMGPMREQREKHAGRAMDALWNLRLRCPGLSQTTLHVFKIQYNKDVGQAILESYSRVLESLASNILNRIEHVQAVNSATMEHLSFARGEVPNSTPATPSSQQSSMDGPFSGGFTPTGDGFFSGSQTPTSPLKEEPVMYTGKTVPVLSSSIVKRPASQATMRAKVV